MDIGTPGHLQTIQELSRFIEPVLRQRVHNGLAAAVARHADGAALDVLVSAATSNRAFDHLVQLVQSHEGLEDWLLSSRSWRNSPDDVLGATRHDLSRYLHHFMVYQTAPTFKESAFKQCLDDIVEFGVSPTRRWIFVVPLINFSLPLAADSISLSDKFRLRAIQPSELRSNNNPPLALPLTHCIEATSCWPRRERPSPASPVNAVTNILTTLRLLKSQGVWTAYFWVRSEDPFHRIPLGWRPFSAAGDRGIPLSNHDSDSRYLLTTDEGDTVRDLWHAVYAARQDGRVTDIVVERFNSAIDRFQANPQDSIIDSWIAIEALLVPGVDRAIAETAARRMEQLLGPSVDGVPTYELMRRSYKVRSKSVHGEIKSDEVRDLAQLTLTRLKAALRARILQSS
jgi:hypothetical protein